MNTKSLFIYLVASCFLYLEMAAQAEDVPPYEKNIASELLQKDLAILQKHLYAVHTGLFEYTTRDDFDKAFGQIAENCSDGMSSIEFTRELRTLLPLISNGHTNIGFHQQFRNDFSVKIRLVPVLFYKEGERHLVARNLSEDETILPGMVLQSINGMAINDIEDIIRERMTRDAQITSGIDRSIARSLVGILPDYIGYSDSYTLELIDLQGNETSYVLNGITVPELVEIRKERYGPSDPNFWSSEEEALQLSIENDLATISMKTYEEKTIKKRNGMSSKKWFDQAFQKISDADIQHLIIDMRGNGGGEPKVSLALLSHLMTEPFVFYQDVYVQTRKIPDPELYEGSEARWLNRLGWLRTKKESDNKYTVGILGTKAAKPRGPHYAGQIYVLTDGDSFSQTGETCGFLEAYTNAKFIGEAPSGSGQKDVSGITLTLTLPHSQIPVYLPIVMWEMNVPHRTPDMGVLMDHELSPTLNDVLAKRDPVMDFAKKLASKGH